MASISALLTLVQQAPNSTSVQLHSGYLRQEKTSSSAWEVSKSTRVTEEELTFLEGGHSFVRRPR
jgi:hypothetical protein